MLAHQMSDRRSAAAMRRIHPMECRGNAACEEGRSVAVDGAPIDPAKWNAVGRLARRQQHASEGGVRPVACRALAVLSSPSQRCTTQVLPMRTQRDRCRATSVLAIASFFFATSCNGAAEVDPSRRGADADDGTPLDTHVAEPGGADVTQDSPWVPGVDAGTDARADAENVDAAADAAAVDACSYTASECRGDDLYRVGPECAAAFVGTCEFGCSDGACDAPPDCGVRTIPGVGEWTPWFATNTDCDCTVDVPNCHSLYQLRIASVDVEQNLAEIEVRKVDTSAGPSVDVAYWVVVSSLAPSCSELTGQVDRSSGTWPAGVSPLSLTIPIWPSQDAFATAAPEARVNLAVITGGGGGYETERIWWSPEPLSFVKECER